MSDSFDESSSSDISSICFSSHTDSFMPQNPTNSEFPLNYLPIPNTNNFNPPESNNHIQHPEDLYTKNFQESPDPPTNSSPTHFKRPNTYHNQEWQNILAFPNPSNSIKYLTVIPPKPPKRFIPKVQEKFKVYEVEEKSESILLSQVMNEQGSIIIENKENSEVKKPDYFHTKSFLEIFPGLKFRKTFKEMLLCRKFSPLQKLARIRASDINSRERKKGVSILKEYYSEFDEKWVENCSIFEIYMLASISECCEITCFIRKDQDFIKDITDFIDKSLDLFSPYAAKYPGDSIISFLFMHIRDFVIEKIRFSRYTYTETCLEEYLNNLN